MKDWITLKTNAFTTLFDLLKNTQATSAMYAVTATTGCGKTHTVKNYQSVNENVYYYKIEKVLTPKDLYLEILLSLGVSDYDRRVPLKFLADRVSFILKQKKGRILLIFDEAGKFSAEMMEYFQTIRDATDTNVGIVLIGTPKFKKDIEAWVYKQYLGIPELNSRIYSWHDLTTPSQNEKYQIVKKNGVTDPRIIKKIASESEDLRKVYQKVMEYRRTISEKNCIPEPDEEIVLVNSN